MMWAHGRRPRLAPFGLAIPAGRWIACLLVALLSAIPICGARGEPHPGSLIDRTRGMPRPSELDDAARRNRYAAAYAACVARSHRRLAETMLAQPYLSQEQSRIALQISDSSCLGPGEITLRYPAARLVGRIAAFFILERYADADVARFAGLSDEALAQLGLVPRNNAEDMAYCVLRRDPRAVRALIGTAWESPQEAEAIRRIVPHLGPCAPAGERLDLNAAAVRLLLAAGLYRALSIASAAEAGGR
jgi:hypothetical protein